MQAPIRLPATPGWIGEFKTFLMRGNVVDLAVGIVIGAAFTAIVTSLVKDLITPVLGLILGGIDFTNIFLTLKGPKEATLEAAQKAGAVTMNVGVFLNALISFIIVSFAVFWLVKVVNRFTRKAVVEEVVAAPSRTEELLAEIRNLLAHSEARPPV